MKKTRLILFIAVITSVNLLFSSCSKDKDDEEAAISSTTANTEQTATIDFEDVTVDSILYKASFTSGIITFKNVYTSSWDSWIGFACSTKTDTVTAGSTNQYSSYAGSGAGNSKKFGIAYSDSATFYFGAGISHKINSLMLTNNTYAGLSMKNGDSYSKKFVSGDYYKVTITGISTNGAITGRIDYYLADFRSGKSFICKNWVAVDLSGLGSVNKLIFTFASTDNGSYGMNTPAYVCVDNIVYVK
ncbi:MAG: DUF4465 domain-containing protein [Paludibacteraceae bacterium]|nr:DUF4465 domain-containing protein [Paludibacteraceae bacterium]